MQSLDVGSPSVLLGPLLLKLLFPLLSWSQGLLFMEWKLKQFIALTPFRYLMLFLSELGESLGRAFTASSHWAQGHLSASVCKAALLSSTGKHHWCWQGRSKRVHSSAPPVHVLFSWCECSSTGKTPIQGTKGCKKQWGWGEVGRGTRSSIRSQIRDRPTTACQQVTWLKGHWSGSFIHALLAGVSLTWGKGVYASVISDELQLRKTTWDSCLSKRMSVSKIHTRQILEFCGPNALVMVKIICVKFRKRLPVNNGWLFPLIVVSQPMTLAHSAQ